MSVPDPATTRWVPLQGTAALTYLGQWASGRTYNDGDAVIGSDGILYLCCVNGTTTAPDRWPGASAPKGDAGPQGPQGVGIPMPVIDGQWIKGQGGAAVWAAIGAADVGGASLVAVTGGQMAGPWPKTFSQTVVLTRKSDVVLSVSASVYLSGALATVGFIPQWDGANLSWWGDMFFNEASSHKMLTAHNIVRGAAAGAHTVGVAHSGTTSDANDRATYSAVVVAVP